MKLLSFTLLFLTFSIASFGQGSNACGTVPSQDYLDWYKALDIDHRVATGGTEATINIPVQFHLVGKNDGTGRIPTHRAYEIVCALNNFFAPVDMYFFMPNFPNLISNSNFYNLPDYSVGSQMMSLFNRENLVNIYICDLSNFSGAGFAICGYATLPGSGSPSQANKRGGMVIGMGQCSSPNGTTITHEMGHYMSLLHPFQGTNSFPSSPSSELVTRTGLGSGTFLANCGTAGDRLCDTESDYLQGGWNGCTMTHTQRDANTDLFRPESSLYMSYSGDNCQSKFSPGQIGLMRSSSNNDRPYLQAIQMGPLNILSSTTSNMLPVDNSTNEIGGWTRFKWKGTPGATKYHVQISERTIFDADLIIDAIYTDTTFIYTGFKMSLGKTYRWRVRPLNASHNCAPFSSQTLFSLGSVKTVDLIAEGIKIFPTVVTNNQPISIQSETTKNLQLTLLSVEGKVVRNLNSQNGSFEIQTADLTKGIYFIQLKNQEQVYTQKIVISE